MFAFFKAPDEGAHEFIQFALGVDAAAQRLRHAAAIVADAFQVHAAIGSGDVIVAWIGVEAAIVAFGVGLGRAAGELVDVGG